MGLAGSAAGMRIALGLALVTCACAAEQPPRPVFNASDLAGRTFVVPAREPWTSTDVFVHAGDLVEITGAGTAQIARWAWTGHEGPRSVGPEGTHDYPRDATYRKYPAPAAGAGPAAPFGLIARVGETGRPISIGRHRIFEARGSGRLYLGVNDYEHADNDGAFDAGVRVLGPGDAPPDAFDDRPLLAGEVGPRPVDDARVLVIFADGLHYEALREMALAGYLPNFRKIFFDGGLDVGPTFTVSPSNTIVATTASLTGAWPDRTGLFAQLVLDRESGDINYLASPEGPVKAVEHIDEAWWEAPFRDPDRPPLFKRRVEDQDLVFRSTVIPVMPDYPPDRYVQRVANEMPLFGAHLLKDYYFDRAETAYSLDDVIEHDSRVMFVYYTGFDAAMHRSTRGAWGESRRDLYRLDQDLGKLSSELEREGLADKTYLVLYADHNSTGGRDYIPQSWDVANDLLYRNIIDLDHDRVPDRAGGLGLNVKYQLGDLTLMRRHTDVPEEDFTICVAQAYDHAWVALPVGGSRSRDWQGRNDWFQLTSYEVHPDFEPVDVPRLLLDSVSERGNLYEDIVGDHPVGFVLMAMDPDKVLVVARESMAVIQRRRMAERRFQYRYARVERIVRSAGGRAELVEGRGTRDPFGYLQDPALRELLAREPGWLGAWHDDREWLEATAGAFYPDAVVSYAHMLLNDPDQPRFDERSRYDVAVVAAPGWNFHPAEYPAAPDHGGADRWEKRIPFFIAGPGLPQGVRVDRPSRIIDVVPTALELAAIPYEPETMDGRAVREIWNAPETAIAMAPEPVTLFYDEPLAVPLPDDEKVHGPLGHDPKKWYDMHNLAANLATLTSQEVLRMTDRAADAIIPGNEVRPTAKGITALAHTYDRLPESKLKRRPAQLIDALRIHTITIGELTSPTQSLQHIDRVALTIDWLRDVINDPFGEPWPKRFTPVTPIDLGLKQVSRGLLFTRRVLLEWMQRGMSAALHGIEAIYRSGADAPVAQEWETASVFREPAAVETAGESIPESRLRSALDGDVSHPRSEVD
jgi:hypothetical protein